MKKRLVYLILLLCPVFGVNGQHYHSELLKSIAGSLPRTVLPADNQPLVLNQQNYRLHVISKNDTITHIGVRLFNRLPGEYRKASHFLERIMLEFLLAKDNEGIKRILETKHCSLLYNEVDYVKGPLWNIDKGLALANGSNDFSIVRDSLVYVAKWTSTPNSFTVRFPANAQIILGMDKKELDEAFINDLLSVKTTGHQEIPTLPKHTLNLEKIGNIYRTKGHTLFIPEMNDCCYYLKGGDSSYRTLFSSDYPAESLVNLFHQSSDNNSRIRLSIQHVQYGNVLKEYNISLNRLYEYAQVNGFEVYVGIESRRNDQMAATVLLFNKELNYLNILYVRTSSAQLYQPSGGTMTATLRTNIPMDNISDLFQRHYPKNHFR